jgi:hypothetical protein
MLIVTDTPDANGGVTLFARIPEALDEPHRRLKYDVPLAGSLAARGFACSVRGFSLPSADEGPRGVGIEVRAGSAEPLEQVVRLIVDLGAAPETIVEIETDATMVRFSLAGVAGT